MRLETGIAAALLAASAAPAHTAPICTDRPTKANATCTVPANSWQVESSAVQWLRLKQGGSESETLSIGATVVKLGLTDRSDLQIGVTPLVRVTTDGDHLSGFGDVLVRYKHRLTAADKPIQVAIIPFVKLPTAMTGIGNDKVEGGVAMPVSFTLVGPVMATFGPELDVLADADGRGRHAAIVQLVNLSAAVAPRLTLIGELWASWNFDPDGIVRQASADVAAAYAVSERLQLDAGANVGLNRATADVELYAGASIRF